jgi:glycosyltransferase involved in cell wall biosynthesis
MQVAVFHPGTQHSWQTALALQDLGRLRWYATSIYYQPARWPYRLEAFAPPPLRRALNREFRRFHQPRLDPRLVRTAGVYEWAERIAARLGWRLTARRLDAIGNRRFASALAAEIRGPDPFALWGYNGSSRVAFAAAREQGRTCILDRTIGDLRAYNRLMADLQERYPDWFIAMERAVPADSIANDDAEYALADVILVGSRFAATTVQDEGGAAATAGKVRVLRYCYDEALFGSVPPPAPSDPTRPVRFLFVGQINPRKGVHHVLEAIARLPRHEAELTIVGDLLIPRETFARYADRVTLIPQVPRTEIPALMAAHDVLVFPSYFEGAGIVLYEALAAGLGIIQGANADVVVSDDTGILMDRLDTDLLEAAMRVPIADRARLDGWRAAAQPAAREYSFARYRENIAALLRDLGL